jgi:hypothetical protein
MTELIVGILVAFGGETFLKALTQFQIEHLKTQTLYFFELLPGAGKAGTVRTGANLGGLRQSVGKRGIGGGHEEDLNAGGADSRTKTECSGGLPKRQNLFQKCAFDAVHFLEKLQRGLFQGLAVPEKRSRDRGGRSMLE